MTQPSNGSASNTGADIRYTPNANFCGQDQFTYTVMDPTGECSETATVTVNVVCTGVLTGSPTANPTKEPTPSPIAAIATSAPMAPVCPVANDDFATTSQGSSVVVFVLTNDVVPDGKIHGILT